MKPMNFERNAHRVSDTQFERFCQPRAVTIREGQTLEDVMKFALPDVILQNHAVVMIDAEVIPRENWGRIRPKLGRSIVRVGLRPAGKSGKKILRTALLIAVVVVAAWIAGPAGVAILGSTIAATLAAAAFTLAANLAINALLPIPPGGANARTETDPTYSLQGTRNSLRPRQTVEVPLGTHRYTPSLITEQYQQVVGDDVWLVFGVCVGVGNYEFSDWRLGENPLTNYTGVEIQESPLLTSPRQTLIPGDFTQKDLGIELDTSWHTERTNRDAADFEVMLSFARGLGTADKKGKPESVAVTVEVQYREVYDDDSVGTWRSQAAETGFDADIAAQTALGDSQSNRLAYWGSETSLSAFQNALPGGGNTTSRTFRRSDTKPFAARIRVAVPPGQQYDVRVRRTTAKDTDVAVANEVTWFRLNTWSDRDLTPDPRLATAFFRLKASGELSGVVSNLNVIAKKVIPTFSGDPLTFDPAFATSADWAGTPTPSRNPADLLLDAGRGAHTLRPNSDDDFYWPSYASFWIWCDENAFTFDLPIVQELSRNEVEELIAAAGRGRVFRGTDGKKRIAIDRVRIEGPTQLITPKNARGFAFTRTFSKPVHALRIPFTNADEDYQDDELTVYAPGYDENNATEFQEISTPGQTDPSRVYESGDYYLTSARLLSTVVNFELDIERSSLSLGELVRLQHPLLNSVSVSARLLDVTGPSLTLDTPANFISGETYGLRYRKVIDHGDGTGSIEAEGFVGLVNPGVETDVVSLSESLPSGTILEPGDLAVVGILGEDTFEGFVKSVEPSGPRQADVELVAYLPERLTRPPAPVHVPLAIRNWSDLPAPELIGSEATPDGIFVTFEMPDEVESRVASFRAESRLSIAFDTGQDQNWTELPLLTKDTRTVTLLPGRPGEQYDIRVFAIDYDGVASPPLTVLGILSSSLGLVPENLALAPRVQGSANTAQFGVVDVSVDAGDPAFVDRLLIEWRSVQPSGQDWSAPTTAPADNPVKTLTGLPPGMVIQVRVAWVDHRGSATPEVDRPIASVTVPATFTAQETLNVGGTSAANVLADIQTNATGVGDLVTTYGSTASAALSASNAAASQSAAETAENNAETAQGIAEAARDTASGHASDANTDRLAAQTARSGAETAETNAVTAKDDAESAESAAATSASLSAGSATDSGNSATAASNSANTATTKADEASASANTATTERIDAEAARDAADTAASASAASASQASASETDAEAAATSATTSENNTATSESNALASEGAAAASETNAAGSAAAASTSETLSAEAQTASELATLRNRPSTMEDFGRYFTNQVTAAPETANDADNSGSVSSGTDSDGPHLRTATATVNSTLSQKQAIPYIVGDTYRVRAAIKRLVGTGGQVALRGRFLTADYLTNQGVAASTVTTSAPATLTDYEFEFTATQAEYDTGTRLVKAEINPNTELVQALGVYFLDIQNITSAADAAASAAAALTSEAAAAVSATDAGTFATTSQTHSQTSQTQAGIATAEASSATASASSANTSAVAAAASQTITATAQAATEAAASVSRTPTFEAGGRFFAFTSNAALSPTSTSSATDSVNFTAGDDADGYYIEGPASNAATLLQKAGVPAVVGDSYKVKVRVKASVSNSVIYLRTRYLSADYSAQYSISQSAGITIPSGVSEHEFEVTLTQAKYNQGTRHIIAEVLVNQQSNAAQKFYFLDIQNVTLAGKVETLVAEVAVNAATVADLEGNAEAYRSVEVGANGAMTRFVQRAVSDGTHSFTEALLQANQIVLQGGETFFVLNSVGATLNGVLIIVDQIANPNVMLVQGPGFGATNDLIMWVGPYNSDISTLTSSNGARAITIGGKSYLGGSDELASTIQAS